MRTVRVGAVLLLAATVGCGFGDVSDGFAPLVSITSPLGTEVTQTVQFSANVIDETGVARVRFMVDGAILADDLEEPYTTQWDTRQVADGSHLLQVQAEDLSGNSASASKSVTVSNIKN